jgi:cytochrome b involved in lipid metabolism
MNYYSIQEVAKHNKENDCWVIANNNVYDVTFFLNFHPGGKLAILKNAGKEQTESYNFHGQLAKTMWKSYKIGELSYSNKSNKCCCHIS